MAGLGDLNKWLLIGVVHPLIPSVSRLIAPVCYPYKQAHFLGGNTSCLSVQPGVLADLRLVGVWGEMGEATPATHQTVDCYNCSG